MKGYAVILLLGLTMAFGSVQLSFSQCDQANAPTGYKIISSIGELGGIDFSRNEILLDEETYTLSPSLVFCTNQGKQISRKAIVPGSIVAYDYTEEHEIISLTVEVVPDEHDDVLVRQPSSDTGVGGNSNHANMAGREKESVQQTLHYENGVWKN